jgi:hypothetical protein
MPMLMMPCSSFSYSNTRGVTVMMWHTGVFRSNRRVMTWHASVLGVITG